AQAALELWREVGQHARRCVNISFRKHRSEMLEDVQLDAASRARVEVPMVLAAPAECFSRHDLQPREIDLPRAKVVNVRIWKIIADNSDETDVRKKTRADGGIRRRTAEQVG